jgi:hypothetical protein
MKTTLKTAFYNTADDIDWLKCTHLSGKILPEFNSFIQHGNEDCPEKIELFSDANPHVKTKPCVVFELRDEPQFHYVRIG